MMKSPRIKGLDQSGAEQIGIQALTFLAADNDRLAKFLSLTGIAPAELIAGAHTPPMLAAILDHLSTDESLLLTFATEIGLAPEKVSAAIVLLEANR